MGQLFAGLGFPELSRRTHEPATPELARLTRSTDAEDPGAARALEEEVEKRPVTQWLMTHPGVDR